MMFLKNDEFRNPNDERNPKVEIRKGVSSQFGEVFVVQQFFVSRKQRNIQHTRGGNNNFVGGVTAESVRQASRFDEDVLIEFQQPKIGQRQSNFQPIVEGAIQSKLSKLVLLGNLPDRNGTDSQSAASVRFEQLPVA